MPFSNRFALLILAGTVLIILSGFAGIEFYIFLLYNLLLVALLVIDYLLTPGIWAFEVSRHCEQKLSMGTENEIRIKVRNNSGYPLVIELRDEIPPFLRLLRDNLRFTAVPHQETDGTYVVVPEKRGQFTLGNIHIRYSGILKLCAKKGHFQTEASYKVYPNLKDLSKYGLASIRKNQMMHGIRKTRVHGIGTEFESLREYSEGDDYRKVNWLATARSSKLIVNTFEPERNQQIMILLDSSRVMNSEINYIKKLDYAVNSSFLLADVAIKKGDNIGVMVFDSSVKRFIKPGKGLSQFQLIAENLYNVEENFVTADYKGALMYLNQYQKRRSLLCIFTELFNSDEAVDLAKAVKTLAKNHVPLVITIKDMRLYETVDKRIEDVNDVFLKSTAIKLLEEREKIKKIFNESGIASIDVPPDRLSVEVVNKYLTMKSTLQI